MAGTKLGPVGLGPVGPSNPEPPEPVVNEEVSFDVAFKSNEFLVNNNVLSNYQHTKHISTTEPLYLDGMAGSDNIVHKLLRGAKASFGDYLLSDLKTIVAQADIKDELKADVVGICIGQNPINKKLVFWNVNSIIDGNTYQFSTNDQLSLSNFTITSLESTGMIFPDNSDLSYSVSDVEYSGLKGSILGCSVIGAEPEDFVYPIKDFSGLRSTIEWYKQASAAGYDFRALEGAKKLPSALPAIMHIMQMSGVTSLDDSYDGWFLGSAGYISLIIDLYDQDLLSGTIGAWSKATKLNAINEALAHIGLESEPGEFAGYWTSTFFFQDEIGARLLTFMGPVGPYWGSAPFTYSGRLFALKEVSGTYIKNDIDVEQGTDPGEDPGTLPTE